MERDSKPDIVERGSLRRTKNERGSYGPVLLLLILTIITMMVGTTVTVDTLLSGAILVLTLWISKISNRLLYVSSIVCGFCFFLSLTLELNSFMQWIWLTRALGAALLFLTGVAIWSRFQRYSVVSRQMVWAALCIYLLIG